jgi:hypothetical protein
MSLMDADAHRAKTLSSIAAVASAFLVFVIGGGLMLGVWASQRNDATLAASALEAERIAEAQARQSKLELEEEDARLSAEQAQAAKKKPSPFDAVDGRRNRPGPRRSRFG